MKLKRVKILGFKTFADKTEFELDGDIVAVVGPNGCGKSNIVDAVLWGLGETNARALRAQSGKEVIFAGSVHRKPQGMAEVVLTFENEDGALPIDSPEVSVTRRVDRSGQGEYEINRRNCRLKDVADLLSDSGLGRAGYAIVGQSEIDQALAASAQQRRAWIDEAAGVQRYRARRQESIRRLDAAQLHLQRVHDVLRELDAQREPLAAEAEVAMRYKSALKSLRQVECGLLVKEVGSLVDELRAVDQVIQEAMEWANKEAALADQQEADARKKSAEAVKIEAEVEAIRNDHTRARTLADQASSALQVASTRLESLAELQSNLEAEAAAALTRYEHAEADLEVARAQQAEEAAAYERLQTELAGSGDDVKLLAAELEEAEQALNAARVAVAEIHRNELERVHREQRVSDIKKEIKGIDDTTPDLVAGITEAQDSLKALESRAEELRVEAASLEGVLHELRKKDEAEGQETRRILTDLASLDGKRRGIEATIDAHEGLSQGSRAVLDLRKKGQLQGDFVPVGDCIQVEPDLALAMDTALGASANDLIVPDESYAKAAIALLKENSLGRATFQPVTLMRPHHVPEDLRKVCKQGGVIGLASELVKCPDRVRPVIDSLLGRVLVVETIDDALRLAKSSGWNRCVTLDGELLHSSGAVTGGRTMRQTAGLVQRQAELAECKKAMKALQAAHAKAESASAARASARDEAQAKVGACREAIKPLSQEIEEGRSWLNSLRHELNSAERSKSKLESELESLTATVDGPVEAIDVAAIEARRDDVWKRLSAKSGDAETAKERLEEARLREETSKRRVRDCERRLEILLDAEKQREHRAGNLEPEREKHIAAIQEQTAERDRHAEQASVLELKLEELNHQRKASSEQARASIEEAQRARRAVADAEARAHQSELKRARLDGKRAVSLERLLEEYGVNEAQAIADAPTTVVPPDAASVAGRLRRELKEMGEVNLGAVEAFERLTERYDELNGQSLDIEGGISEILSSVKALDALTKERFSETFEKVKIAFGETFKRVFGGGEGILELVGGEDELDAGVEIRVTIPGKKCQRLELLSGGERALSAIAFLFSLLKVKPSPLVILDEVDAPLDGRNVERFIGLMRDFSNETQFILVTHNPMTIESADVWFGVTMQEPGVSTLVPFKVPDKTAVKAVVPDVYLKG
ncbi:MAG: chromosome segregation protein SMC [Armatimonadetes bacterium]|nr:chromosome segregation protein SMC [Armatimonadota bacterium]